MILKIVVSQDTDVPSGSFSSPLVEKILTANVSANSRKMAMIDKVASGNPK